MPAKWGKGTGEEGETPLGLRSIASGARGRPRARNARESERHRGVGARAALMYSALIHEIVLPSPAFVRPPTTKRSSSTTTREPQIRRARARVRRRHGFVIPGIDSLRFTVAPTGTGDVHVRVSSRDGSSHDDAGEDDDATTRLSRIPPATHLYPLDPNPPRTRSSASAPPNARARTPPMHARAPPRDRRPTGGRAPPPRPAPSRLGTLRPEDHRGAHPPGASTPRSSATSGAIPRRQPRATRTLRKPRNPRPRSDGARWRWTTPARRGLISLARQPGASSDVRGSYANVPFTPSGAGWETAAAEASAAREASARHASVGWLAEYEAGVFSGTPGFDPSPWADPPAAARRTGTSITIAIAPRR